MASQLTHAVAVDRESSAAFVVEGLTKEFERGRFSALRGISLTIKDGEMIAVTGPSGSGKSTLLHLLGGLDQPSGGRVLYHGQPLTSMDLSRYRAREVGFIFQSFHLVEVLTAAENVQIPLFEGTRPRKEWRRHAERLLDSVGLLGHADKLPSQLSGGERQRVAIARSLANDPAVLLADEPTGNLDTETSHKILELIGAIHRARQLTIVLVTHDPSVAAAAERLVRLQDGRVVEDRGR